MKHVDERVGPDPVVFVPWEDVFVYRDIDILRAQTTETEFRAFGNSQAQSGWRPR